MTLHQRAKLVGGEPDATLTRVLDIEVGPRVPAAVDAGSGSPSTAAPDDVFASIPVFDPTQLDAVAGDDLGEARTVIELFGHCAGGQMEELVDAARQGNVEVFRSVAHAFKGSAGMIGAKRLHHRLSALESAAQLPSELTAPIRELRRELEITLVTLDAWLEAEGGKRK